MDEVLIASVSFISNGNEDGYNGINIRASQDGENTNTVNSIYSSGDELGVIKFY